MLLHDPLENQADTQGSKTALVFGSSKFSYADLNGSSNRLANALAALGVKRGDRVLVYLPNSPEVVVAIYGALKAGGVFVVVNPQVKAGKLEYIVSDCRPQTIVTDGAGLAGLRDMSEASSLVVTGPSVARDALDRHGGPTLRYADVMQDYDDSRPKPNCIDVDLASLIYTSGSTGNPKAIMLTHLNMLTAARSIITYLENTPDDVVIDMLPLSFDYGLYQVLMSLTFGGTVVLEKSFLFPSQILDSIHRNKVTGFPLVPTIAALLLKLRNLHGLDFPDLRYITSTGQALPSAHIARLREIFPNTKIYSMYGLTECKRVSYLPPEELERRPTSVGKAIPNTETYIIDDEGREIVTPRHPGQLVVRGSHVMAGYWGMPEKSAEILKPGRYPGERVLYTGDVFERDDEGFLYFLGRKDDMFKSSGQLVSPREVEDAIHQCPGVMEAAVVGEDDDLLGRAVVAYVVRTEGSKLGEDDIIKFVSDRLEKHLVPKRIIFRDSFPRTSSGKVLKSALANFADGG